MFQTRPVPPATYSHLPQNGNSQPSIRQGTSWPSQMRILAIVILALSSFMLGRLTVAHESKSWTTGMFNLTDVFSQTSAHVFMYNQTFGQDSPAADAAWKDVFPKHGGFFSHPLVSPHRATFSVYHYLHCLDGLRRSYWAVFNMAVEGKRPALDGGDMPMMTSPPHVRHCIDLLRQGLMCRPDLTVEVKDEVAGGVHGFGESHQCVEWTRLNEWVAEWEN